MTSSRTFAKRLLAVPVRLGRVLRTPPTRWILTFHEVGAHPWATAPDAFARILEAVAASAAVLPLEDVLRADEAGALRVAVTFDDGYLGVAEHAVPVLERLQLPATVFLPTDLLAERDGLPPQDRGLYAGVPLVGWSTVRRLAASPLLRFESHGAAHRALSGLAAEARLDDLRRSREAIASATGRTPRFLAYPFGAADRATAATARDAGFEAAFTTRHGGLRAVGDPFLLPRIDVRGDYTPRDVLAMLRGDWDFLAWSQALRGPRA